MKTISEPDTTIDVIAEDGKSPDLRQLIHDDNKTIAELFFQFTQAEEDETKKEIFEAIKTGMTIHAQIVDEHLYQTVIDTAEEEDREEAEELVATAEAGNYVASLIIDELADMEPDDKYFEAKMTILCELTRQQVKREEKDMFEKLQAAEDVDFDELGEQAAEIKLNLETRARNASTRSRSKSQAKSKGKAPKKSAKKSPAKKATKPASKSGKSTKKSSTASTKSKKASAKKPVARSKSSTKSPAAKKRSR